MTGITKQFLFNPVHFVALGFGTGCAPKAPGTFGTLVGVLLYFFMQALNWYYYIALVIVLFVFGIWICGKTAENMGKHDHPAIVWDEVVGYLLTMFCAPQGWIWLIIGFVAFRFFDICKPWPIAWLDSQVGGGLGIMLDDIFAAIYALLVIQFIAYLL